MWSEKYRPQNIFDMVGNEDDRKQFVEWFEMEIYGDDGLNVDEFKSEIGRKELNTYRD